MIISPPTEPTTDERVAKILDTLVARRAERKDILDLPGSMTGREIQAYHAQTALLDARINAIRVATTALAELPPIDADVEWRDQLVLWRKTICDELLAPDDTRVRDRAEIVRQQRLVSSLRLIDHGLGSSPMAVVTLTPTRVGELMADAGYATEGPSHRGPHGWRGGIREVEQRIKDITKRRAAAQAALDAALMTDDERADQEAETRALRSLRLRANADGTGYVVLDQDGRPRKLDTLTPVERAAFERADAAYRRERQDTHDRHSAGR